MWTKIKEWLDPNTEIKKKIEESKKRNADFVSSLDMRQRDYYFSLTDSWRKELVRLEKRVYDLENHEKV